MKTEKALCERSIRLYSINKKKRFSFNNLKKTRFSLKNLGRFRDEALIMIDKGAHIPYRPTVRVISEAVKKGEFPWIKMENLEED